MSTKESNTLGISVLLSFSDSELPSLSVRFLPLACTTCSALSDKKDCKAKISAWTISKCWWFRAILANRANDLPNW